MYSGKELLLINRSINNNVLSALAIISISMINVMFTAKYMGRYFGMSAVITGCIIIFIFPVAMLYVNKILNFKTLNNRRSISEIITYGAIITVFIASVIMFTGYPQGQLQIDRFEMINLFWDNVSSNNCPYCPRSIGTNIPGPFPFYFYFAWPFYNVNEIGFIPLTAVVGFIMMLHFCNKGSIGQVNLLTIVLISSPGILYEIAARSTIFFNSLLILIGCIVFSKVAAGNLLRVGLCGVILGLIMSTRSIAVLIILMYVVFTFRTQAISWKYIVLIIISVVTFCLTFIPVLILCKENFAVYNPFAVQSLLIPTGIVSLTAIVAVIASLFIRKTSTFYFFTGFMCIVLFVEHLLSVKDVGIINAIKNSNADITYALFSFPFLFWGIATSGNDAVEHKWCVK